ncbi:MAG: CDP-diacylglycerol--serine O-phosphatidyltransferase [Acidobacteriota bacterium]|nr:CDP-diacylglycerol--serine O-phosphatidyltransferase [Acidobacteriota bacterium]
MSLAPPKRPIRGRLRGVAGYLPGALTLGNVLAGYLAILLASQGRLLTAAILIFAAAVLDGLDGRVARLTGTTSDFGEELDSLADAVSFAVAPSIIAFHFALADLGRVGWGACFLYAACGVIRLARFNAAAGEHKDFIGVPSPTAAAAVACPALFTGGETLASFLVPGYLLLVVVIGLLMISPVRYFSPKNLRFGPRPYRALALWAAILAGLIMRYEWVVPGLILLYLLSPLFRPWFGRRRKRASVPRSSAPSSSSRDKAE